MTIRERDVYNLPFIKFPLSKWRKLEDGDIIYEADKKDVRLREQNIGDESIITEVKVKNKDTIQVSRDVRLNTWENPMPFEKPRFFYDNQSLEVSSNKINELLNGGCRLGKRKQISWISNE